MSARAGTTVEAVVLRPRRVLVAAWVGAVLVVVGFTVVALLLRNSPTGVYFRVADQVALVLMGLFIAAGLLLFARPRVRADREGIEVRNVGASRRLPWAVVERVAFPDGASWARLDLPDDEYLPVLAVQAADGRRAVEGITRLRALHTAARAAGSGAARPTTDAPTDAPTGTPAGSPTDAPAARPSAGGSGDGRDGSERHRP